MNDKPELKWFEKPMRICAIQTADDSPGADALKVWGRMGFNVEQLLHAIGDGYFAAFDEGRHREALRAYLAEARRVAFQREMEIIRRMDAASTLRQHLDSYLTDVRDWLDDGERVLGKRIRVRPSVPTNAPTAALEDADLRCQRPLGRAIAALDKSVWEALHTAERREAGGILVREVDRNVLRQGGPAVLTRIVDVGARPAHDPAPTHCTVPDCASVGWCALYTVPVPV